MFEMRAKMITVGLLGAAAMLPIDHAKADQLGHASWYSLPANITANGEQMDPTELTAAHRSLPFGTRVVVENLANGRSVVVRINDRGPFIGGRIIDLSKAAAASIGMIDAGTAKVRVTTADGNALAALGEATAKAKNGASLAAVAKVDIAPSEMPPKATSAPHKPSLTKSVVAKASARTKYAAKRLDAQARVRVASATKRSYAAKGARSPIRVAASSYGIRAAAEQASSFPSRRIVVASNEHPYAILGSTPGFMKPSRTRRRAG
jgi:peptidoglycan lytic transglycosylase